MASVIGDLLVELDAALEAFAPQVEGLRDFAALELSPEATLAVDKALGRFKERLSKLQNTRRAVQMLAEDGHPEPLPQEIAQAVLDELRKNRDTIEAAFSQFRSPAQAESLNVTASIEPA